jgi:hypothetical protein
MSSFNETYTENEIQTVLKETIDALEKVQAFIEQQKQTIIGLEAENEELRGEMPFGQTDPLDNMPMISRPPLNEREAPNGR